ncbi:MAG: dCTP deaminase [Methylocella sp.]
MLDCNTLAKFVRDGNNGDCDGLSIIPDPEIGTIETSGEASVTLRLGRWFITLRQTSHPFFDVMASAKEAHSEARSAKRFFIPFGQEFILHPGRFVLASTLEWLSFPARLGGYLIGKSSWARRGLIIETSAGIHPGFNGCLTLELANVGEVPIKIRPGMKIAQIFVHELLAGEHLSKSQLKGRRRPYLGTIQSDWIMEKLSDGRA